MYAVLSLCQILGAIQDDAAANSSAVRRVFFKKEAVRLAVIINDDLFCAAPLEMPPQDSSQLAPQNRPPGNLMEIFPAVELITRHEHFRDGKVVPLCAIHILSIFHKDMERLIGQPNILLPAVYFTGADLLKPGEPDPSILMSPGLCVSRRTAKEPQSPEISRFCGRCSSCWSSLLKMEKL